MPKSKVRKKKNRPGRPTPPSTPASKVKGESPTWYVEQLLQRGLTVDAWETTYFHLLQGEDAVLEWVTGTTLRAILDELDAEEQDDFRASYGQLLREISIAGGDLPAGRLISQWQAFHRITDTALLEFQSVICRD